MTNDEAVKTANELLEFIEGCGCRSEGYVWETYNKAIGLRNMLLRRVDHEGPMGAEEERQ